MTEKPEKTEGAPPPKTHVAVTREQKSRAIEAVLCIPSSGHAAAGELADTILDALESLEIEEATAEPGEHREVLDAIQSHNSGEQE